MEERIATGEGVDSSSISSVSQRTVREGGGEWGESRAPEKQSLGMHYRRTLAQVILSTQTYTSIILLSPPLSFSFYI